MTVNYSLWLLRPQMWHLYKFVVKTWFFIMTVPNSLENSDHKCDICANLWYRMTLCLFFGFHVLSPSNFWWCTEAFQDENARVRGHWAHLTPTGAWVVLPIPSGQPLCRNVSSRCPAAWARFSWRRSSSVVPADLDAQTSSSLDSWTKNCVFKILVDLWLRVILSACSVAC
jgi:hypothetical protein